MRPANHVRNLYIEEEGMSTFKLKDKEWMNVNSVCLSSLKIIRAVVA